MKGKFQSGYPRRFDDVFDEPKKHDDAQPSKAQTPHKLHDPMRAEVRDPILTQDMLPHGNR